MPRPGRQPLRPPAIGDFWAILKNRDIKHQRWGSPPHAPNDLPRHHATPSTYSKRESQMSRIGIFAYGVLSYLVFFAVFLYGIGFIGGFLTPTSLDGVPTASLGHALAADLALLAAFAFQHSGMARRAINAWPKRFVPEAAD